MSQEQVLSILAILKAAYPNFYKDATDKDLQDVIDLWSTMFVDDNPAIVTEAVKALICTLKYPPSIADVKEKIRLITQPEEMTEIEAWNRVKGAISYYSSQDNFLGLPEILQKLVGSPNQLREWAIMDIGQLETVVKSNFMRSYAAKARTAQQYDCLPGSTKELIGGLSEKFKMLE
jgi:hypothetical protein